jgi:hypothetical protein
MNGIVLQLALMYENNLARTLKSLCTLLNDEHVDYCLIGRLVVAIVAKRLI